MRRMPGLAPARVIPPLASERAPGSFVSLTPREEYEICNYYGAHLEPPLAQNGQFDGKVSYARIG